MIVANIVLVNIITDETTPVAYTFDTGSEANVDPYVSEGSENVLRVKNKILAQNNFEDIVLGYNTTFKDVAFDVNAFALIDGGTLTDESGAFVYEGPQLGTALTRTKFTLDIWTEEKDEDGATLSYQRFRLKNASGSPVKFSLKNESFFAPEYTIKSRPKSGEKPLQIKSFDELPATSATAAELLAA